MARVRALVGVALCCLAVSVGCKSAEFAGALAIDAATSQTVGGSLDVVAADVYVKLQKLNLKVVAQTQDDKGNTYYLSCQTAAGVRFRLVLTREGTGAAEKTNMKLEWVDPRDSAFGLHLLVDAAAQKRN